MRRRELLKSLLGGAGVVAAAATPGVPKLNAEVVEQVREGLTHEQKVAMERQIRIYVKSTGGFRKDLHVREKIHCENLLAIVGRQKPEWDVNIRVQGFEDTESLIKSIEV